jgi:hypothetical protein
MQFAGLTYAAKGIEASCRAARESPTSCFFSKRICPKF